MITAHNNGGREALLDKLTESISAFIDKVDHPEDGVLVINPADPFEFKIVYVEDLLFPTKKQRDGMNIRFLR